MKKFILSGIILLAYSAAIAQNQAVLNQVGAPGEAGNYGSILQQGAGNNSSINQNLNSQNNFGFVVQFGTNNTQADIIQSSTSAGNLAQIKQGTVGSPVLGNEAIIAQQNVSSANEALITQVGNDNGASIWQIDQSKSNEATIEQQGSASAATIEQKLTSTDNLAKITQSGASSQGIIEQNNLSNNNKAFINQAGSDLNGRISQSNTVSNSEAYIDQHGSTNSALIQQTNQSSGIARIIQNVQTSFGSGNMAAVFQGSGSNGSSSGNYTLVMQENSNNVSQNEQLGMNNVAFINQSGNGNILAGLGNDPIAHQIGANNQLYVTQIGGNMAHVSQIGTGNVAIINQVKN